MKNTETNIFNELQERAKELNCVYRIQELLSDTDKNTEDVLKGIIRVIPDGWQYPDITRVRIEYLDKKYQSPDFKETGWVLESEIKVQDEKFGAIQIYYTEERSPCDEGPFLKEERKLINTISELVAVYFFHKRLKSVFEQNNTKSQKPEWRVILEMLGNTDPKLLINISRKLVNFLCWKGVSEGRMLFEYFIPEYLEGSGVHEANFPYSVKNKTDFISISSKIFEVASQYLSEKEMIENIGSWIKQNRSDFIVNTLNNISTTVGEINAVLERYHHLESQGLQLSAERDVSLRVKFIRRILSDHEQFIKVAKKFVTLDDFHGILGKVVYHPDSHGKLGGKSSGLILAANILNKSKLSDEYAKQFKLPKTWYIVSDTMSKFMEFNHLEDIVEQKHKDIEHIRIEYPYVSYIFKNSYFPPEITKVLSNMLDDFGKNPLVIRSSSLLEDRLSSVFAGKYKSLFISNQGTKKERLEELTDAIAEVYASTFGPDPIEYRIERDLVHFHEEMGILIQEVIGTRIGKYFLPAFAGVGFSQNNYRWSGRIEQNDGLLRLVPGLGTRAVDRISDDYPILIVPGKPNLRANVIIDEIIKYSPKKIDVINLEKRGFETVKIDTLLKEYGHEYPIVHQLVSAIAENHIQDRSRLRMNFKNENYVVTFNGLIDKTDFIKQLKSTLYVLQEELGHPVDIEFAHDGKDFYLLQCRSQGHGIVHRPAEIPVNIPEEDLLFSATKYITNGTITNNTYLVYVDPEKYGELAGTDQLKSVGKAIGRLNNLLPKRKFILMGPGRWGSRGDIKLGVSVTYSEINNTSVLIEIARKQQDYVPELSFGTHFFQDLVEANILYLPLYPDERGSEFNYEFFENADNLFSELLPDFEDLSDVIKVIDIPASANGRVLNLLMNADQNMAVAVLDERSLTPGIDKTEEQKTTTAKDPDFFWRWRLSAAEQIAANIDPDRFGVVRFYIFGSTKNATASRDSDIDILIHFRGSDTQRDNLVLWLDGWGKSLEYSYFLATGFELSGLLDIHIVTDEDIRNKTSFAVKIGAITDAARPLPIGTNL